jgi:hypothetical protein
LVKELGKEHFKKPRNAQECLQTASADRDRFLQTLQTVVNDFEEDK